MARRQDQIPEPSQRQAKPKSTSKARSASRKQTRARARSPREPGKTALVVMGMHRSGTSALARVLGLLGADLPRNLLPPQPDNPEGFWEPLELVRLHDEMLRAAGSSWDDTGLIPAFWEDSQFIRPYQKRIVETLKKDYGDSTLFVVKDPRIARFVPVITGALREAKAEPKFVIAIRNPLEVAASLKERNHFHFAKSLLLWLDHTLRAERSTREFARTFILYDDFLRDWRGTLLTAAADLKLTFPAWSSQIDVRVESFVSWALRHHTYTLEDVLVREDIAEWVKVSFEAVRLLAQGKPGEHLRQLDRVYGEFATAQTAFGPLLAQEQLSVQHLAKERDSARSEAAERQKEAKRLTKALDGARSEAAERQREAERLSKELNERVGEAKALRQRVTSLEARLAGVYASRSWRITGPLRAVSRGLRWLLRNTRRALMLVWWLSTGQFRRAAKASLPYYQRFVPVRVKAMIPDSVRHAVKGRIVSRAARVEATNNSSVNGEGSPPLFAPKCSPPPALAGVRTAPSTPRRRPMVSIIVLNRNGAALLDAMLRSFLATNTYPHYEFIIVDHASTDGSLKLLNRWGELLPIRVIACDRNYSFSYSNNRAVEVAAGELLLLLNNDIVFTQDVLDRMVAALETENVGAVGLKQYLGHPGRIGPHSIHHIGIRFGWQVEGRFLQPRNQSETALDHVCASSLASFPAVTAAILLCRKHDYLAVGGLDEGYVYGYEDVDFCCKLRLWLKYEVVSLNNIHAFHNESSTREREPSEESRKQRLGNRERLRSRFGYQLRREFVQRLLDDDGSFTGRRPKVGFAVTTIDMAHGAGDLYTAFGLGEALHNLYGWEVCYLPKQRWYDASGLDVYISMRDDVDINQLVSTEPHLITVAWLRNWLDRWSEHPWTELFDVHLCSSQYGVEYMWETRRLRCHLFPLAVDLNLFNNGPVQLKYETDYVYTGNNWEAPIPREIEHFDPGALSYKFTVYGKNWDRHRSFASCHGGFLDHTELPKVYNSAKITIDDSVSHATKLWGSLNSRVFEALAAGSLVLTNNAIGAAELFDSKLPVWHDASELSHLLHNYLDNPRERIALVESLRQRVVQHHSYHLRAQTLRQILADATESSRIAIKCPVPRESEAEAWGDYHFARSLGHALVRIGYRVRIDLMPQWYCAQTMADDVVIVLRGLTAYKTSPDQINLCWIISHPEKITDAELENYDHVFVASTSYAERLRACLKVPVSILLQCSDPDVFHPPVNTGAIVPEDLLFVGSSRKQRRKIVQDCIDQKLPLVVHGRDWENLIPAEMAKSTHIPNAELHRYYGRAKIILNDHWPDMARHGFISNRIFDVALAGGFVISDQFVGSEIFEGSVVTYKEAPDLARVCRRWLEDDAGRRDMAGRLRRLVLNAHTFAHRVEMIDDVIQACHAARTAFEVRRQTPCDSLKKSTGGPNQ